MERCTSTSRTLGATALRHTKPSSRSVFPSVSSFPPKRKKRPVPTADGKNGSPQHRSTLTASADGLGGTLHEEVAKELGIGFVPELFVDIEYSQQGALIPPAQSKSISPQESAERARKVAETGHNFAQGGGDVKMPEFGHAENDGKCKPFSICIHSDLPGAERTVAE